MSSAELMPFLSVTILSLKVAFFAVLMTAPFAIGFGWFFARFKFPFKSVLETFFQLPMVIPPVATGLFLLYLLSPNNPVGRLAEVVYGGSLLLTWLAAAMASAVVAFPLFFRSAKLAFAQIPEDLEKLARSMGKNPLQIFWQVSLPLAKGGIVYGLLLAFARAMGEFGATSLVAGHIPGQTETLALAIYADILAGRDERAWIYTGIAVGLTFLVTLSAEALMRSKEAH